MSGGGVKVASSLGRGGSGVMPDFFAVVAALLALILLVDISVLWLTGRQVPDLLGQLIFGVFGFYFGRSPLPQKSPDPPAGGMAVEDRPTVVRRTVAPRPGATLSPAPTALRLLLPRLARRPPSSCWTGARSGGSRDPLGAPAFLLGRGLPPFRVKCHDRAGHRWAWNRVF